MCGASYVSLLPRRRHGKRLSLMRQRITLVGTRNFWPLSHRFSPVDRLLRPYQPEEPGRREGRGTRSWYALQLANLWRCHDEVPAVFSALASSMANAASFLRPRWMLTLTSAGDWPVAAEAAPMLTPCSFTSRITRAWAGVSHLSRSCRTAALSAASPRSSVGRSWNGRAAKRAAFRTWSIHLWRAIAATHGPKGLEGR